MPLPSSNDFRIPALKDVRVPPPEIKGFSHETATRIANDVANMPRSKIPVAMLSRYGGMHSTAKNQHLTAGEVVVVDNSSPKAPTKAPTKEPQKMLFVSDVRSDKYSLLGPIKNVDLRENGDKLVTYDPSGTRRNPDVILHGGECKLLIKDSSYGRAFTFGQNQESVAVSDAGSQISLQPQFAKRGAVEPSKAEPNRDLTGVYDTVIDDASTSKEPSAPKRELTGRGDVSTSKEPSTLEGTLAVAEKINARLNRNQVPQTPFNTHPSSMTDEMRKGLDTEAPAKSTCRSFFEDPKVLASLGGTVVSLASLVAGIVLMAKGTEEEEKPEFPEEPVAPTAPTKPEAPSEQDISAAKDAARIDATNEFRDYWLDPEKWGEGKVDQNGTMLSEPYETNSYYEVEPFPETNSWGCSSTITEKGKDALKKLSDERAAEAEAKLNSQYQAELDKYEKDMAYYSNTELKQYEKDLAQYKIDVAAYPEKLAAWEAAQEEKSSLNKLLSMLLMAAGAAGTATSGTFLTHSLSTASNRGQTSIRG